MPLGILGFLFQRGTRVKTLTSSLQYRPSGRTSRLISKGLSLESKRLERKIPVFEENGFSREAFWTPKR